MAATRSDQLPLSLRRGLGVALGVALAIAPNFAADRAVNPQRAGEPVTYMNYELPAALGPVAGEASVGANWKTDALMFGTALQSLTIGVEDCSSPQIGIWDDLRGASISEGPENSVRFTDSQTGRTFAAYVSGKRSLVAFSDSDGLTWTRNDVGEIPSGVSRTILGGGAFHAPLTRDPSGSLYPNALYSCSQQKAGASCARSDDGGVTFGPAVAIRATGDCTGIAGRLRVAPDGTVYVPGGRCGDGQQSVVVSEDNGATWAVRTIPGSEGAEEIANASLGIASDGTIYFGYVDGDGHPKFAVSQDKGLGWTRIGDLGLGLGIQNASFPAMVAGDPDRAAFAFMGSPVADNGPALDRSTTHASYVYIAHTYDGGQTWTIVNVTAKDAVQLDATIDRLGRVVVGQAAGTSVAGVARQVNGKRLFAQYDRIDVPAATLAVAKVDASNRSQAHLSWSAPDDHGSAIIGYRIERRTASGTLSSRVEIPPQLTYDDAIVPDQSYVYRITAINAVGEGPSCSEVVLEPVSPNDVFGIPGQATVALGSASTFGVLAASTATNTGATTVNGDLGVSPGTTVTGAPIVTGTLHLGDPIAAQAQLDLTTAYNDAAGRTVGAVTMAGNLGGLTLAPGLYKSTSTLEISLGDLTLDAQGDPNAVFIFQMGSSLVTTTGRQVILSGGAQAANIFWQVGSSATLGTNSVFKGNILALASITVTTGATVQGRLLARTGAVALDSNTVGLGASGETIRPTVNSIVPAPNATNVPLYQKITARFSESMDPLTINTTTFSLKQGATPIAGTVSYAGTTATFTPTANLTASTVYTATITTGAHDLAGNLLINNLNWSFTSTATADTTPPTVSSTIPANGASTVPITQQPSATFSETMDASTISAATFTLTQGATPISGTVSFSGVTATFTPSGNLTPSTVYTITITTGVKDLSGNAMLNNNVSSFTTGASSDATRPTVNAIGPASGATGVVLYTKITARFSESMDPLTLNTGTFGLKQGVTPVAGTVSYAGTTATFTPSGNLTASTVYTATITTGAHDLAGNLLINSLNWSFTTGVNTDSTPPTVLSTVPANAAVTVSIGQQLSVTFSEAMRASSINTATFTLTQGATPISGTVGSSGVTATFTPSGTLTPSTVYTATITTGATDLPGNAIASNNVWSFTTSASSDTTRPTVNSIVPAPGATGVLLNQKVTARFSEAMAPLTINTTTFSLKQGATPIAGSVTYAGLTATFTPSADLAPLTVYTASITTGAHDVAGNLLINNLNWSFTTVAGSTTQATVALGSASTFGVLAASTATNTGATTVNGDLGVSPGTTVTGAPIVTGTLHLGDPIAAQAQLDLTTAYNDAAGRTVGAVTMAGNLGGLTLAPGLYKSTSTLEISSGDLTLDAQGDANAVFIFQMGSSLVTTTGRQVILSGGAQAANIFWQVGSSATLGTNSVFKGNILALASITVTTGATVQGRLLARTGAVALDSNTVGF